MRTFLLNKSAPILKWGLLPQNIRYQGEIPEGFDLAVNPHYPYIIVDVDRHGKDGFLHIPEHLNGELEATLNYPTKRNGKHYWFYYSGDKQLANKASGYGIDLRIGYTCDTNDKIIHNGGYVKWHPRDEYKIEDVLWKAKETSIEMNKWLETLFSYVC